MLKLTHILLIHQIYALETHRSVTPHNTTDDNLLIKVSMKLSAVESNSTPHHVSTAVSASPKLAPLVTSPKIPTQSTQNSIPSSLKTIKSEYKTTKAYELLEQDLELNKPKQAEPIESPINSGNSLKAPIIPDSENSSPRKHHASQTFSGNGLREPHLQMSADLAQPFESGNLVGDNAYLPHVSMIHVLVICCIVAVLVVCVWKPLCHMLYGVYSGYYARNLIGNTGSGGGYTSNKVAYHRLSTESV
ncbi:unnamed protein product [Heterobilharzia americana]|nr:unnamed protein product [Heterobilharzia americana]